MIYRLLKFLFCSMINEITRRFSRIAFIDITSWCLNILKSWKKKEKRKPLVMRFYWLQQNSNWRLKLLTLLLLRLSVCRGTVFIVMNWEKQKTYKILVKMATEFHHFNILLSFVRSISRSNDPDQLLSNNKVPEIEHSVCLLIR